MHWNVEFSGLQGVFLDGQPVNQAGQTTVCPTTTHTYQLKVSYDYEYGKYAFDDTADIGGDGPFWIPLTASAEYYVNFTLNTTLPTSTPMPTLTPTPTDTPQPTPTLIPPNVRLTDFTLADTLTSFSIFQTPIVLKPNTLWIQITNVGQSPFYPPGGSGQYTLQVILKKTGGKLEEYDYVSGQPISLAPLSNLEPGESQTYFVPDLFFRTPTDNAELEVFFSPDTSLGMQNSILSKSVTVQENPDSFQRCVGTVAQAMVGVAKIACPECRAAITYPDLAIRILKCGADSSCVAKENAKWLIGVALSPIGDAGQLLSLAADAIFAMGEPPPCMILSDFINAYLHEALRNKYLVNAIITESPVYPLVANEAGQQAGFLENGQIVEEIPGSKVVVLGEERFILYPGNDASQLSVSGYAEGKMNLYTTFAQGTGLGTSIRYTDVDVTQGMMATLKLSNSQ